VEVGRRRRRGRGGGRGRRQHLGGGRDGGGGGRQHGVRRRHLAVLLRHEKRAHEGTHERRLQQRARHVGQDLVLVDALRQQLLPCHGLEREVGELGGAARLRGEDSRLRAGVGEMTGEHGRLRAGIVQRGREDGCLRAGT